MKISPIVDRDGITALRELHDLLPNAPLTAVLDLAEWLIAVATGPFAVLHPDITRRIQTEPEFLGRLIRLISVPHAEPGSPKGQSADLGDKFQPARATNPVVVDKSPVNSVPVAKAPVAHLQRPASKPAPKKANKPHPKPVREKASAQKTSARGMPWSKEDDAKLQRMRDAGHTWGVVASQLNRTIRSVQQRGARLNAARPKSSAPTAKTAEPAAKLKSTAPASKLEQVILSPDQDAAIEQIRAHLDRLPLDDRFDEASDYAMASSLVRRTQLARVAQEMKITQAELLDRYLALIPDFLRSKGGLLSPDSQNLLLEALRLNAEEAAADAEAGQ